MRRVTYMIQAGPIISSCAMPNRKNKLLKGNRQGEKSRNVIKPSTCSLLFSIYRFSLPTESHMAAGISEGSRLNEIKYVHVVGGKRKPSQLHPFVIEYGVKCRFPEVVLVLIWKENARGLILLYRSTSIRQRCFQKHDGCGGWNVTRI